MLQRINRNGSKSISQSQFTSTKSNNRFPQFEELDNHKSQFNLHLISGGAPILNNFELEAAGDDLFSVVLQIYIFAI